MTRDEQKVLRGVVMAAGKIVAALQADAKLDAKARAGARGEKSALRVAEATSAFDQADSAARALLEVKAAKAAAPTPEPAPAPAPVKRAGGRPRTARAQAAA